VVDYCPFKMTALRLAALNDKDQRWVLQQLSAHQQARVKSELDMLLQLGIKNHDELLALAMPKLPEFSLVQAIQQVKSSKLGPRAVQWFSEAQQS
jgi:hypothetical protein